MRTCGPNQPIAEKLSRDLRHKHTRMPFSWEDAACVTPTAPGKNKAGAVSTHKRKHDVDNLIAMDVTHRIDDPPQHVAKKTTSPLQMDHARVPASMERIDVCLYKVTDCAPHCWPTCVDFRKRLWQVQMQAQVGSNNFLFDFKTKFESFLAEAHTEIGLKEPGLQTLEDEANICLVETDKEDRDRVGFARALAHYVRKSMC